MILLREGLKILVAYDGSNHAKKALAESVDIAKKFRGYITVLHVYPYEPADVNLTPSEVEEEKEKFVSRIRNEVEDVLKNADVKYGFRSETGYDVGDTIMEIAKNEGYDLISIGSRGTGEARALLLGSVSHKVISQAHCDVLVTR